MAAIHGAAASNTFAQAWVPSAGEGTVTVSYQNYYNTGHYDRSNPPRKTPNGATHAKSLLVDFNYGLTDNLAVSINLPFVSSKYVGPRPSYFVGPFETFPGPLDDGAYHGAFQDFRLELRRGFYMGRFAVTPFVAGSVPTHKYETVGEAVPGRHRAELQLGTYAGVDLDDWLRGAYGHVRYWYTTAQRQHDLPYRRSNLDLEGGCAILPRVSVRGVVTWQFAHDAPTLAQLAPIWQIHDRFIVPNFTNAGAGVTIDVTNDVELHGLWIATVKGYGGAHVARMLSVGFTWSFGGALSGLGIAPSRGGGTTQEIKRSGDQ